MESACPNSKAIIFSHQSAALAPSLVYFLLWETVNEKQMYCSYARNGCVYHQCTGDLTP